MQKALPNSLQIFNKKRTRTRDRHFSQTYTQGRETRFLTYYLVAKPLIFLRNPVFCPGIGCMACRMPNLLFPWDFYPLYPLHAGVTSARYSGSQESEVCPMPHAQCPMPCLPHAQCPMPNAQCPMPHAPCPIVPHVTEKGYKSNSVSSSLRQIAAI